MSKVVISSGNIMLQQYIENDVLSAILQELKLVFHAIGNDIHNIN